MLHVIKEEATPGSRVKLKNPDPAYIVGKGNPVMGSIYECEGTICKGGNTSKFSISVKWDNGYQNVYKDNELCFTIEGNFIDIWEEK